MTCVAVIILEDKAYNLRSMRWKKISNEFVTMRHYSSMGVN